MPYTSFSITRNYAIPTLSTTPKDQQRHVVVKAGWDVKNNQDSYHMLRHSHFALDQACKAASRTIPQGDFEVVEYIETALKRESQYPPSTLEVQFETYTIFRAF